MNFDKYWTSLVDRVHRDHEVLQGEEALFYRLSAIRGETFTNGLHGYFSERWTQFEADLAALRSAGFGDLAALYQEARSLLFGDMPLDEENVGEALDRYLDDEELSDEVDGIHADIVEQLDDLEDYRDQLGLRAGFYKSL